MGDITYIRLGERSFGYLSLLLDLNSRRIVAWEFLESMEEGLVLATLREARRELSEYVGYYNVTR